MSQNSVGHSPIKSEIKNTLSLGLPLIASQIVFACSGFIGTAMVARLGEAALAASILVSMLWMSLSVLFFGILNAVGVLVSHQFGAKNHAAISKIMGQSFILVIIMCIFLMIILFCIPYILPLSGQPSAVLKLANHYVYSLLWTIPGLLTLITCEQFLAAIGKTKIVLRISTLVVPVEIPIIYILIFGKFGLPACGVAGVGYGFAITYSISAVLLCIYLLLNNQYKQYKIFSQVNKIDFTYLKELIRVGLPMGLMHVLEVGAFSVITFIVGHFGTTVLAAHQIVLQYLGFIITIVFAMSQAVSIRVGHAVGAQDALGVKYACYIGMFLNFIVVIGIAVLFMTIPKIFFSLDINIDDPANIPLIHDAAGLLAIAGVLILFDNFRIIGFGALRGLKDTTFPMWTSFVCFWLIGLSASYLFAYNFGMQGKGVWWGMTFGIACGAAIILTRIQYLLERVDLSKISEIKNLH